MYSTVFRDDDEMFYDKVIAGALNFAEWSVVHRRDHVQRGFLEATRNACSSLATGRDLRVQK